MRRFLFLAIILFIIVGIFLMIPEKHAPSQENPYAALYHIMKLADASVVEGEFHYWASLGSYPEVNSLAELEARADELLSRFSSFYVDSGSKAPAAETGITHAVLTPGADHTEGPVYMVVESERELQSGGMMRLLLQNMEQEGEKIIQLLVTVIQGGDARELSSIASRIPTLLKPEAQNSNMSFCLTGHLDGLLGSEEMEQLSLLITRDLRGEQVQSISDGGMVSITGYTPELGDYLRAENLRINLNLAMRYDDYLDKTVIWAGTPLISRQY